MNGSVLHPSRPCFQWSRAKEIPSVGSLVAYEFDSRRRTSDFMPPFVAMNFSPGGAGLAGPGMLPATFAPLPIAVQKDGDFSFVVPEEERADSLSDGSSSNGWIALCDRARIDWVDLCLIIMISISGRTK
jgi:hypothetical protein